MGALKDIFDLIKNGPERETEDRDERIVSLKDKLGRSSPFGKKIVDAAETKGTVFCMDDDLGRKAGCFYPATKHVVLNAKMSEDILLAVIVHEARHALQPSGHTHEDTVKSALTVNRAMEADAMAFECAAVAEMKETSPKTYQDFKKGHPLMLERYEAEFQVSGSREKAMGTAFEAWYENAPFVAQYDKSVLDFMAMGSMYRGAYRTERSAADLAEKLCVTDGKSYVPSSFFSSEKALTVSVDTAKRAAEIEKKHIRYLLFKPKTTSADRLFVRLPSGSVKKPDALFVSAALKERSGR